MNPDEHGRTGGLLHTVERIVYLRGLAGFAGLPPEALRPMADAIRERTFAAGDIVGEPGEIPQCVHVIVEGAVELRTNGRPPVVQGPAETVGYASVFGGVERRSRAVAVADTLTLEMDASIVLDLYEDPIYGFTLLMSAIRAVAGNFLDAAGEVPAEASPVVGHPGAGPSTAANWVERLLLLRTLPLFADSDPDALATFARTLELVTLPAGTELWAEGERAQPVFLVHGQLSRAAPDGESSPGLSEAPCALGLLEALSQRPPNPATAIGEVLVLRGDIERLLDVIEDETSIGVGLVRALIRAFVAADLSD